MARNTSVAEVTLLLKMHVTYNNLLTAQDLWQVHYQICQ